MGRDYSVYYSFVLAGNVSALIFSLLLECIINSSLPNSNFPTLSDHFFFSPRTSLPAGNWLKVKVKVLVTQSCLTLGDPMDCSLPGSSVQGILQARILEWVAISFSRGSSQPREQTWILRHCHNINNLVIRQTL